MVEPPMSFIWPSCGTCQSLLPHVYLWTADLCGFLLHLPQQETGWLQDPLGFLPTVLARL